MASKVLTVTLEATTMSEDILQRFMQYLQDFNVAYNDKIHMEIGVDLPTFSTAKVNQLLDSLVPPLPFKNNFSTVGKT